MAKKEKKQNDNGEIAEVQLTETAVGLCRDSSGVFKVVEIKYNLDGDCEISKINDVQSKLQGLGEDEFKRTVSINIFQKLDKEGQ